MPNTLIMPTPLRHRPERYRELLGRAGFTPLDPPGTGKLSEADLRAALPESDALLAWGGPVTAEMIARPGSGSSPAPAPDQQRPVHPRRGLGPQGRPAAAGHDATHLPGRSDEPALRECS